MFQKVLKNFITRTCQIKLLASGDYVTENEFSVNVAPSTIRGMNGENLGGFMTRGINATTN